jgi:hypothetical protein
MVDASYREVVDQEIAVGVAPDGVSLMKVLQGSNGNPPGEGRIDALIAIRALLGARGLVSGDSRLRSVRALADADADLERAGGAVGPLGRSLSPGEGHAPAAPVA